METNPNMLDGHALFPLRKTDANLVEIAGHISEHKVEINFALQNAVNAKLRNLGKFSEHTERNQKTSRSSHNNGEESPQFWEMLQN